MKNPMLFCDEGPQKVPKLRFSKMLAEIYGPKIKILAPRPISPGVCRQIYCKILYV
jgi:hypothetical protein